MISADEKECPAPRVNAGIRAGWAMTTRGSFTSFEPSKKEVMAIIIARRCPVTRPHVAILINLFREASND